MNNYESLELPLVKKEVMKECSFELSKTYLLNEELIFNPLVIKNRLALTNEAHKVILNNGRFRFDNIKDIFNIIDKVNKGLSLNRFEILDILLHNTEIKRIIRNFKMIELDYLSDYVDALYYSQSLIDIISNVIDLNANIKEDASDKLMKLYENERSISDNINEYARRFLSEHANILQESVFYTRNNRVCFLIKNNDKHRYDGFVHGESASGQASYIEPKTLVNLNNQKIKLLEEIDEEIKAILEELSILIKKEANYFKNNLDSLIALDVIFAKANYLFLNDGVLPSLGDELKLIDVAHPLIDKDKVISNTYRFYDKKGIIISGSNTGGKSVSLKVIGLSVLMTYLGYPILAKEASVPLYDDILTDIGENSSIIDSLSTFSSRLVNLNHILNKATNRSLILIDEIASGTDPKEGEALALAIIEALIERSSHFVITTHFSNVKKYALESKDILIASQSFDLDRMLPTYKYIENVLGESKALDIATKYLDDTNIVLNATKILANNSSKEERLLKELERQNQVLNQKSEILDHKLKDLKEKENLLNDKLSKIEQSKAQILLDAKKEANEYLENAKEKANLLVKELKKEHLKVHKVNEVNEKLDLMLNDVSTTSDDKIEIGDTVKVLSTNQVGKVIEIKKHIATVLVNGINLKTKLNNLLFLSKHTEVKVKKVHVDRNYKRPNKELVLVGKRVEEALSILGPYLDACYGANMKSVKVIHGVGTQVLQKAIHDYLRKVKYVKDYRLADVFEGGGAITIVEFKS